VQVIEVLVDLFAPDNDRFVFVTFLGFIGSVH